MFYGGFILFFFLFTNLSNLSSFFPASATIVNLFLSYNLKENYQTCSEFVTFKTTFVLSDQVYIPILCRPTPVYLVPVSIKLQVLKDVGPIKTS